MPKLSVSDLKAKVAAEHADALSAYNASTLSSDRSDAMDYYLGDMSKDMPVPEGRSKVVSTDVADTVEGLMPQLMDIFAGSDEVVRFDPVGPEDEEAAQQETDYINHVFMQQNPGFMVLYSFIKDALLQKTGLVKVWWEEREEKSRETYYDQSEEQFALIAQQALQEDSGLEIVEHSQEVEETQDPVTGQPVQTVKHDVTVVTTRKVEHARVMGVPPEEFGIERSARDIKTCNYCFHEIVTKTEADLIAEGYDEDQVKALTQYEGRIGTESQSRDTVGEDVAGSGATNTASRLVKITEHYIRVDYEGDGRPCLYMVVTGGEEGEILRRDGEEVIVPVDVMPFACTTAIPVTHRFFGRSLADLVMDIQRIKTALMRGMLDNLYLHNNPRVEVARSHTTDTTIDDLLVSRPGGIVRTSQPGGLQWQVVPDITQSIYPAFAYMDSVREMRTGITRQGQGIDANALQNQSATAVNQVFNASQARMKLIARIIAEGVRDIFSLLHATVRKHGQQKQTIRLRNNWVQVDPRQWKTRNDMTINVGLGTGGKAERVAQLMALINLQKEAIGAGLVQLVDPPKLYNSGKELCKLLDYKNPDLFFNDPTATNQDGSPKYPPPPPPPDPKVMAIQVQAQLKAQEDQRKAEIEKIQAEADIATQRDKNASEAAMSEREFQMKERMALLEAELEREKFMREEARKEREHEQKLEFERQKHMASLQQTGMKMEMAAQAHEMKAESASE